jgi:hypothetical protein
MSSVGMLVFVDYSFFNEQRLPYSFRRSTFSSVYAREAITAK